MVMAESALYMIPIGLSDAEPSNVVPTYNIEIARQIRHFIVENVRTARRWLRKCDPSFSFEDVVFFELNRHTDPADLSGMLEPLRKGEAMGVMSEAGCPGIADPGADVVSIAQKEGFKVVPLVGPSSILMSLMASGFNGQSFSFNGYLPIEEGERMRTVKRLERESIDHNRTQIFIETPYRNNSLLEFLCRHLHPDMNLCVASNITDPERESILVKKVFEWKSTSYDYSKQPAIFLIQASANALRSGKSNADKKVYSGRSFHAADKRGKKK